MEKYMGYRARETIKQNGEGRDLPVFEIAGTKFLVDIARMEFRQADDPANRIMMQGVKAAAARKKWVLATCSTIPKPKTITWLAPAAWRSQGMYSW